MRRRRGQRRLIDRLSLRLFTGTSTEERVDMSVAVAYQPSAIGRLTLQEAAKAARLRQTSMSVIHIVEGVDIDMIEDQKVGLRGQLAGVLEEASLTDVEWTLQVATGVDVAETVLDHIADTDAELLVIGARRRSPVGKMILGSVTRTIILHADLPVLVIKEPVHT